MLEVGRWFLGFLFDNNNNVQWNCSLLLCCAATAVYSDTTLRYYTEKKIT